MVINLFKKGTGLQTLQELYRLNDKDVQWIQDNLFEYNGELLSPKQVEETIESFRESVHESEENVAQMRDYLLDRNRCTRWVKDDAAKLFFERFKENNLNDVKFTLKHIASVIDDGDSIRERGLLQINELLYINSPIRRFLFDNGIEIDVPNELIRINKKDYKLDKHTFSSLWYKLYYWNGETEAFICGEWSKMIHYSCISTCPEILDSVDKDIYAGKDTLKIRWLAKKTKTLCLEFDLLLDEFIISEIPDSDVLEKNAWIVRMCLDNMCKNLDLPEKYVALRGIVEPERLRISEI